jgi:hypothetical protein
MSNVASKIGVFASLDTTANTTVTTYYPIQGTFTNNPMDNFSVTADPAIQYDNEEGLQCEVDWHAEIQGDANGINVHVGLMINTGGGFAIVTESLMGTYLKTANEPQCLSGTSVISLKQGYKIQLVLTSDTDGDVITVHNFTTTIRRFY